MPSLPYPQATPVNVPYNFNRYNPWPRDDAPYATAPTPFTPPYAYPVEKSADRDVYRCVQYIWQLWVVGNRLGGQMYGYICTDDTGNRPPATLEQAEQIWQELRYLLEPGWWWQGEIWAPIDPIPPNDPITGAEMQAVYAQGWERVDDNYPERATHYTDLIYSRHSTNVLVRDPDLIWHTYDNVWTYQYLRCQYYTTYTWLRYTRRFTIPMKIGLFPVYLVPLAGVIMAAMMGGVGLHAGTSPGRRLKKS